MPFQDPVIRQSVDRLMEITTVLADLTATPRAFEGSARFLAETFGIAELSIGLVRRRSFEPNGELALFATCGGTSSDARRRLLTLYASGQDVGNTGQWLAEAVSQSTDGLARIGHGSNDIVIARPVDGTHDLVLAFTQPHGWSKQEADDFQIIVAHLVKEVRAMALWHATPTQLGAPFDRLTEREWVVLVGLNSDDGEKQLADRLDLSPHTLHSHIKSIYRKAGVQGRLPLLQSLHAALVQHRRRVMMTRRETPAVSVGRAAS